MLINKKYIQRWVKIYWIMHGKGIIAAYLLMVKQELENHIVWLDINQISGLSQQLAKKFLKGLYSVFYVFIG